MHTPHITLGQIERPHFFQALRRWEPLNIDWDRCLTHFVIKADRTDTWAAMTRQVVESVLAQNGRALIVDRREKTGTKASDINVSGMMFSGRQPKEVGSLEDQATIDNFLNARRSIPDNERLIYIAPEVALTESDSGFPRILQSVETAIGHSLGAAVDPEDVNVTLATDQFTWASAAPVLILSLGKSWIDHNPMVAAQLRATSVSLFHVVTQGHDLTAMASANSSGFLELSAPAIGRNNMASGMIRFMESDPDQRGSSRQVKALFRLSGKSIHEHH